MRFFRVLFGTEPDIGDVYELFGREYRIVDVQQGRVLYERATIYGEFVTPRCEPHSLSVRDFHRYADRLPMLVRR